MEIQYITDVGRRRKTNQDSVGVFINQSNAPLAIVADGMGGHQAGDVASKMLIDLLGEQWKLAGIKSREEAQEWLPPMIQKANKTIHEAGTQNPERTGMGTTLVLVMIFNDEVLYANVGDSRLYVMNATEIKQLTEDHSLVNELVKTGEISEEMAANHPRKNVLTRSVGTPNDVVADLGELTLTSGDTLLLCSDGLTNMVLNEDILKIIQMKTSMEEILNELVNSANEAGGADNITALLVRFDAEGGVSARD